MSASRIFISYSHRGNGPEWKAALLRALQVFEQQHLLDVWEDGKIRVSSYWQDDIERAMDEAALAVVLLTPEALESEFILAKELPRLRDRQRDDNLPVFPVICEPCDWRAHDWLRATQAPNESNPLSDLKPQIQERMFRKLATAIAEDLSRTALADSSTDASPPTDDHIYLDKFPLTRGPGLREEKLIGREQELALLDLAFSQPHSAIVSLVAWGGVGKSMLVQHWLRRLEREGWFGTQRVYAWSFYSQGTQEDRQASEDLFLAHALEWFGAQCEPTLSPWDKGRLLADAVARERTLLILDGIEPLQYPPGPMGGQLRAPGVQSLLKHLARKANSEFRSQKPEANNCLVLVTTRDALTDLADFQRREGSPWGSVLRVDLGNLTDEAGAALLHHAGAKRAGAAEIKPDDTELLAASREVDSHALTLNLLGRFLARAHAGDIRRRDLVKFEEADRKEQGGTTFKMLAAFENWFAKSGEFGARQITVLQIVGLFDRPADAECIAVLRNLPPISGLTNPLFDSKSVFMFKSRYKPICDEDWNTIISFLSDFQLIASYEENGVRCLHCHPLIRDYFGSRLQEIAPHAWKAAHKRLYEHLSKGVSKWAHLKIEDVNRLYQAALHGCKAGDHSKSLENIYWQRIQKKEDGYAWKKLGTSGSDLAFLASFVQGSWDSPAPGVSNEDFRFILNEITLRLRCLGRTTEALSAHEADFRFTQKKKIMSSYSGAAIRLGNIAETYLALGLISDAIGFALSAVELIDQSDDWFQKVHLRSIYGDALLSAGRPKDARLAFDEAEAIQRKQRLAPPLLYAIRNFRYCEAALVGTERYAWNLNMCRAPVALEGPRYSVTIDDVSKRLGKSYDLCNQEGWLLDAGLDLLETGRGLLYQAQMIPIFAGGDRVSAAQCALRYLSGAEERLRAASNLEFFPYFLLTDSWVQFFIGNMGVAQDNLDEAWDIAERGPMRLHLSDIHLYRARLFFREKTYPWVSPQADLAAAEKLINECGYHRRDEELADAKRAILGA